MVVSLNKIIEEDHLEGLKKYFNIDSVNGEELGFC